MHAGTWSASTSDCKSNSLEYTWTPQATARAGNALGQVGVGSGLVVTLGSMAVGAAAYPQIAACMVGGAAIGTRRICRLAALLHDE